MTIIPTPEELARVKKARAVQIVAEKIAKHLAACRLTSSSEKLLVIKISEVLDKECK